jgi:hypothetical protein
MEMKTAAKKTDTVPAASAVPPAPAKDPAKGEKTPAYVAWLRKYHPERLNGKFANWNNK